MPSLVPIQATLFRGGTSKGPLFLASDLPRDKGKLDAVLLAAMGSPHKRQVDGIGSAKIAHQQGRYRLAVLAQRRRCRLSVRAGKYREPARRLQSNCGNMLSAIAPSPSKRLVAARRKYVVRIYNIDTDSVVEATIETENGEVLYDGDAAIDGVPGTSAPVIENFAKTVGSKDAETSPTGNATETIDGVEVTCIDVAVPVVMMEAASVGSKAMRRRPTSNYAPN